MRKLTVLALLCCLVFLTSCQPERHLQIGSKYITENMILAEMMAVMAEQAGIPVERRVPYGNSFDCQEGIKAGDIDLYPEYTGTGLAMMGVPAIRDNDRAIQEVKRLFEPFHLQWHDRLGIDNSYVLVMLPSRTTRQGITDISHLAGETVPIQFGTGEEFPSRAVDGLNAMTRRYGINAGRDHLITDEKKDLYHALLKEHIDVVVGYGTDGYIEEFGLIVLKDDLGFFPPYEVAPLVRREAVTMYPALKSALKLLSGVLDNKTMRLLNKRVEIDGLDPRLVAEEFLVEKGLLDTLPEEKIRKKMLVAMPPSSPSRRFSRIKGVALEAVRSANPGRHVELREFADPVAAMLKGKAFVAVLGAESFFRIHPDNLPELDPRIEAVAVVGHRMIHLIGKKDSGPDGLSGGNPKGNPAITLTGIKRLGVGLEGSSSHHVAGILLDAYGLTGNASLEFGLYEEQVRSLEENKLAAILKIAEMEDNQLSLSFREHGLALLPITGWEQEDRQFRYPFFRLSTIPAGTYPAVEHPVETLSTQVVLAGPRGPRGQRGDGGPGSAIQLVRRSLPAVMKRKLVKSVGFGETIDPTLPGENVGRISRREKHLPINPSPETSILSALVLFGLGYLIYRLLKQDQDEI